MLQIYTNSLSVLWVVAPVMGFLVCTIFKAQGRRLSIGGILCSLMLLSRIGFNLGCLLEVFTYYYSALPSLTRISNFMKLKEKELKNQEGNGLSVGEVSLNNYTGSWHDFGSLRQIKRMNLEIDDSLAEEEELLLKSEELPVLRDINLKVPAGEFVCVVGKVGSGKSSLFSAITGELRKQKGTVKSGGRVALVSQQAFLINDTLRNNILFGKEYEEKRYMEVLRVCQLESDLEILPSGDQTEIGERGINMSGGQKQRISLARAVYSDSDIYLIDDCLSALDAYVGQAVLDEVLLGYLRRRNKTVIMTTHHTHFLHRVDKVVVMEAGRISLKGTFEYLQQEPKFMSDYLTKVEKSKKNEEKPILEDYKIEQKKEENQKKLALLASMSGENDSHPGKIVKAEKRFTGVVDHSVFGFYIKKGGRTLFLLTSITFALSVTASFATDWWAAKWLSTDLNLKNSTCIKIYLFLIAIFFTTCFIKSYLFSSFAPRATYRIYKKMVWNLLRKPVSFFDSTQSGVIINRAVDDMEMVEIDFAKQAYLFSDFFMVMVASLVLVLGTSFFFIFVIILISILNAIAFVRYLRATTELKRIFKISRSGVLSKFSELVNGRTQISLYGYTTYLKRQWEDEQEVSVSAELHEHYCFAWLTMCLNFSFALLALVIGSFVVFKKNKG